LTDDAFLKIEIPFGFFYIFHEKFNFEIV
jgi:hypothetical protein